MGQGQSNEAPTLEQRDAMARLARQAMEAEHPATTDGTANTAQHQRTPTRGQAADATVDLATGSMVQPPAAGVPASDAAEPLEAEAEACPTPGVPPEPPCSPATSFAVTAGVNFDAASLPHQQGQHHQPQQNTVNGDQAARVGAAFNEALGALRTTSAEPATPPSSPAARPIVDAHGAHVPHSRSLDQEQLQRMATGADVRAPAALQAVDLAAPRTPSPAGAIATTAQSNGANQSGGNVATAAGTSGAPRGHPHTRDELANEDSATPSDDTVITHSASARQTPPPSLARASSATPPPPPPPAPTVMKAWVATDAGAGVEGIRAVANWTVPEPKAGEVRVKIICAALNPVDWKRLGWAFSDLPTSFIPGVDAAGIVEKIGGANDGRASATALDAAQKLMPGTRVYLHHDLKKTHGTFCEYTITSADAVAPISAALSFADAAAMPCAAWTAYVMLFDKLRITPGATVLITGATGGVGAYAVDLAVHAGARVLCLCAAPPDSDVARTLKARGAAAVIDRGQPSVVVQKAVLDFLNPNGPVDAVTGAPIDKSANRKSEEDEGCSTVYQFDGVDAVCDCAGMMEASTGAELLCSLLRFGGQAATTLCPGPLTGTGAVTSSSEASVDKQQQAPSKAAVAADTKTKKASAVAAADTKQRTSDASGSAQNTTLATAAAATMAESVPVFFRRQLSVHTVFLGGLHGSPATRPLLSHIGAQCAAIAAAALENQASTTSTSPTASASTGPKVVAGKEASQAAAGFAAVPRPAALCGHVAELIKFDQVQTALGMMQAGSVRGKVVLSFVPPVVAKRSCLPQN